MKNKTLVTEGLQFKPKNWHKGDPIVVQDIFDAIRKFVATYGKTPGWVTLHKDTLYYHQTLIHVRRCEMKAIVRPGYIWVTSRTPQSTYLPRAVAEDNKHEQLVMPKTDGF